MKFKFLLSLILTVIIGTSCTKSKMETPAPDTQEMATARSAIDATNAMLSGSTWKVSSCISHGTDHTTRLANYDFTFVSNGTLAATNGAGTKMGKWVTAYIDGKIRVSLIFPNEPSFIVMDGQWTVAEKTAQSVYMLDAVYMRDMLGLAKK